MSCLAANRRQVYVVQSGEGWMLSLASELWQFLRIRKKFWLLPVFLAMLLFGGLTVLTKGSAVAPFIYTLF
jgi:hypothetical protein